jgi:hypothetical protein
MTDTQPQIDTSALMSFIAGKESTVAPSIDAGKRVMKIVHRMDRFWERKAGPRDVATAAVAVLAGLGVVLWVLTVVQ